MSAYALEDDNKLNLQRAKKLNQVEGKKGISKSFKSISTDDLMAKAKRNRKYDDVDISSFKKVKLIDVVLETLANSDLLKSSREKVIQYELKVKNAMAEFYPTLNYEYNWGKTRGKPDSDSNSKFKYFSDQSYKFILKQNLYSGGGSISNFKSVVRRLDVAKNQYRIVLDDEIKKAVKAYFDVVFANRSVLVNERNMKPCSLAVHCCLASQWQSYIGGDVSYWEISPDRERCIARQFEHPLPDTFRIAKFF